MSQVSSGDQSPRADKTSLELTVSIVIAYVSNNVVPIGEMSNFISTIHGALESCSSAAAPVEPQAAAVPQTPAISVKKSVTPDHIVCLEDGMKFKSLKRHLMTKYGLSPDEYRRKWGLPQDYPMVAPNYAEARSRLAKEMGLGRKAGQTARVRKQAA